MLFLDFDKLSARNIYVLGVLSAILSGICLQMTHLTRRSGVYYNYSESVITFIPLFISLGLSFALFTLSYNYKPEGSENRFIQDNLFVEMIWIGIFCFTARSALSMSFEDENPD